MFNKKQKYTREVMVETKNDYGEEVVSYVPASNIEMFISLQSHNEVITNDVGVTQCTHVGITSDTVTIGDRINGKWEVIFINKAGREDIVYMKEINSNGIF